MKKSFWDAGKEHGARIDKEASRIRMRDNTKKAWPKEIRAEPGKRVRKIKPPIGRGGK